MANENWDYDNTKPALAGWYAILYSWDASEWVFVGMDHWNGEKWGLELPVLAVHGPHISREYANEWAQEHHPEGLSPAAVDGNVEAVIAKYRKRAAFGLEKYGVTTRRDDLGLLDWLTHLQEELMDAVVYIEAAKSKMKGGET